MTTRPRLLIIEDEPAIRQGLVDVFIYHGYAVDWSDDGEDGLARARQGDYDLVLLDVMLPGRDGYAICNALRSHNRYQPIIMLTARASDEDVITGLTVGADDYVTKPFSIRELVLRVEAVLRRSGRRSTSDTLLRFADSFELDTRTLTGQRPDSVARIAFTRTEVDILIYLLRHGQRPVSRAELLEQVWGYARSEEIETRTVDIHIAKLRKKIEPDPRQPRYLITVRTEGYQLLAHGPGPGPGPGT